MKRALWSMGEVSLHGIEAPPVPQCVLPMSLDCSVTYVPGPYQHGG
jgi:hypothetical protein